MNNVDNDNIENIHKNHAEDDFETKLNDLRKKNVIHNDTVHNQTNEDHYHDRHQRTNFQISRERMTKMKMPIVK
eukprot:1276375-Heterocapsa_arctica.AAC.1